MANRLELSMAVHVMEVSLIRRPIIERLQCNHCATFYEFTEIWLDGQRLSMQTLPSWLKIHCALAYYGHCYV